MTTAQFQGFDKIYRLYRDVIVTEKLDGTNACVIVGEDGTVAAQSRSRIITPEDDNFGFARWVTEHEEELRAGLGHGYHYGEWWGAGIQRRYSMKEKAFSLFNVSRWTDDVRPACCRVVPKLYEGPMFCEAFQAAVDIKESVAAPGFMNPEGVVVFHVQSQYLFKVTTGGDGHKGSRPEVLP